MTIHASKGLEFPILFLFTGFSENKRSDFYKFHDKNGYTVYDLLKQDENKAKSSREEAFEQKRLFYVACTRAILKLYIPIFEGVDNRTKPGPAGKFIKDAAEKAFGKDNRINAEVVKLVNTLDLGSSSERCEGSSPSFCTKCSCGEVG